MTKKNIIEICKFRNSKKVFCKIHKTKLEFHYNQRLCKTCLKIRNKKQYEKKLKAKNTKFQFFGVIKK